MQRLDSQTQRHVTGAQDWTHAGGEGASSAQQPIVLARIHTSTHALNAAITPKLCRLDASHLNATAREQARQPPRLNQPPGAKGPRGGDTTLKLEWRARVREASASVRSMRAIRSCWFVRTGAAVSPPTRICTWTSSRSHHPHPCRCVHPHSHLQSIPLCTHAHSLTQRRFLGPPHRCPACYLRTRGRER
jgi:hypothetical protein